MLQWAFAAAPGHPALRQVCERIARHEGDLLSEDARQDVLERTGPGPWTDAAPTPGSVRAHRPPRLDERLSLSQVLQWAFAAAPGHPALRQVCEHIACHEGDLFSEDVRQDVLERTGPGPWTDAAPTPGGVRAHRPPRLDERLSLSQVLQWAFAAAPGHPALREVCEHIARHEGDLLSEDARQDVLERTGPGPWTDAVLRHARLHPPPKVLSHASPKLLLQRRRSIAPGVTANVLGLGPWTDAILRHACWLRLPKVSSFKRSGPELDLCVTPEDVPPP